MNKEKALKQCTQQIIRLFYYDSVTLLDKVLSDDTNEPEYSANTAYDRLDMIVLFYNLSCEGESLSVESLLEKTGYSIESIQLLQEKCKDEKRRHDLLRNAQKYRDPNTGDGTMC